MVVASRPSPTAMDSIRAGITRTKRTAPPPTNQVVPRRMKWTTDGLLKRRWFRDSSNERLLHRQFFGSGRQFSAAFGSQSLGSRWSRTGSSLVELVEDLIVFIWVQAAMLNSSSPVPAATAYRSTVSATRPTIVATFRTSTAVPKRSERGICLQTGSRKARFILKLNLRVRYSFGISFL